MKPTIAIKLAALEANTRQIVERCAALDIEICGVTKASGGMPLVARSMLKGGVKMLGESRLENIRRLRVAGIHAPVMLLRIPTLSRADEAVRLCDISLNSEYDTVKALSEAALQQGKTHQVIIMLEMGDRREGVVREDLLPLCQYTHDLPGVELVGIGCNFMCVSGVVPSPEKLQQLTDAAGEIEQALGIKLCYVSGGNSANLSNLENPLPPSQLNQLRVGASILLGEDPVNGGFLPGLHNDVFTIEAELVEIQLKPSLPEGEVARDAFGGVPTFEDKGERVRGILNLGRADVRFEGLTPLMPGVEVIAASSDHLVVDVTDAPGLRVGDKLTFRPDYGALLQAMLSPYLSKRLSGRKALVPKPHTVRLYANASLVALPVCQSFLSEVEKLGLKTAIDGELQTGELPLYIVADRGREPQINHAELGVICIDSAPGDLSGFPAENTAVLGLQRASAEQAELIRERNILALTMEAIDLTGAQDSIRQALRQVTDTTDGFALILHASAAKGMNDDPLGSGLSYRECSLMMERIAASQQLRAITLSGIQEGQSAEVLEVAFAYLLSGLGKQILG